MEGTDVSTAEDETASPAPSPWSAVLAGICCHLFCVCWVPILCLLGAANVNEAKCEAPMEMGMWLKCGGFIALLLKPTLALIMFICVSDAKPEITKHVVDEGSKVFDIPMFIWGWTILSRCSDQCAEDPGKVNPYLLMKVFLVLQLVVISMACCCICCCIAAVLKGKQEEGEKLEDDSSSSE
mmetsp:Transcript_20062/g.45279  ORF Transcript_20062/g.45279 Transcript_20062/m.45279 type:complete len:182 (-) Transcript_20062:77-622(-)|eukprot:CAMPEP_0180562796 /NCGR_PEP_ID=MMETSP1037_2-20121125/4114_1 /TAXON_ID=632150 /ORGANISM="Azadinium spinosum, Strain 3D9" /LENGTH=181 /DNA_ID=CAMNT_0022579545 /DNA_START=80 /DNA_END=625 /DNA_ORIENTATION=-